MYAVDVADEDQGAGWRQSERHWKPLSARRSFALLQQHAVV